jgi:hypothetical protein
MDAGFYVIQLTNTGAGWHLHLHVIFRGGFISQAQLSKQWCEITHGSYIVDIRVAERWQLALSYLLSDFRGKPRIRPIDAEVYNSLLHGSRLVQGFGEYSKIKLRVPFRCPICGDCSWTFLEVLLGERKRFRASYIEGPT